MRLSHGLFCVCIGMMATLSADTAADIKVLDQEIAALEERDRVLKDKASYASEEAERLLFEDWIDYREHIQDMERYQAEDKLVRMKIEELKKQRAKLQATVH